VLHYARDVLLNNLQQPLLLFYLNQNSHYPWDPLPKLAEDWQALDTPAEEGDPAPMTEVDHPQLRANYLASIDYSLDMLTDFVINHKDENAIFVLVGDHQPPRVSRRDDSYDTPVHIISRDADAVASLMQVGFVEGTLVDPPVATMHHEGLFSLLVRTLVQNYGERPAQAPPFLPGGVLPPDWIQEIEEE
jgi:hypothetical protein